MARSIGTILLLALTTALPAAEPVRKDAHGDPLPPGAIARFGSIRFRHFDTIHAVVFSPDGRLIASAGDDAIRLWETATGRPVHVLRTGDDAACRLAFSPDGKLLASGSASGTILLWDIASGKEVERLTRSGGRRVHALAFSPDGKTLAGDVERVVTLFDVASGQQVREMPGIHPFLSELVFAPDGNTLAMVSRHHASLCDPAKGKERRRLEWKASDNDLGSNAINLGLDVIIQGEGLMERPGRRFRPAILSADGRTLTLGNEDAVEDWDLTRGERLRRFEPDEGRCLALSPDGDRLVAQHRSGLHFTLCSRSTRRGWRLGHGTGPGSSLRDAAFSPDGKLLATAGDDQRIRLWDVTTGKERLLPGGTETGNLRQVLSDDGKTLIGLNQDRLVRHWQAETGRLLKQTRLEEFAIDRGYLVALSADGRWAVAEAPSQEAPNKLTLWDTTTGQRVRSFGPHEAVAAFLAFSPAGQVLVVTDNDGKVYLYDFTTGRLLHQLAGHEGAVRAGAIAPDGKTLVTGGVDGRICVWDTATGRQRDVLRGHWGSAPIRGVAFAGDGKTFATSGEDECVCLWDAATLKRRQRFAVSGEAIVLALSADGKMAVTGGDRDHFRIWDTATGQERARVAGHRGAARALFAADDKMLMVTGGDGIALAWDVETLLKLYPPTEVLPEKHALPQGAIARLGSMRCRFGSALVQLKFSPDSKLAAALHQDQGRTKIRLWDVASGQEVRRLQEADQNLTGGWLQFSPDGRRLIAGDSGYGIMVWEVATGKKLGSIVGRVGNCAYSPDGKILAAVPSVPTMAGLLIPPEVFGRFRIGGIDSQINLLDAHTGVQFAQLKDHRSKILDVAFSPDGRRLASFSSRLSVDGGEADIPPTINLWDVATGKQLRQFRVDCSSLAWTPEGRLLALRDEDGKTWVYDLLADRPVFQAPQASRQALLSPDAGTLVVVGKEATLYDLKSGKVIRQLEGRIPHNAYLFVFSSDGKLLARQGDDAADPGTFHIWDVATGKRLHRPEAHSVSVAAIAYSPDGQRFASGDHEGQVLLWKPGEPKPERRLPGHAAAVTSLCFAPDGKRLASADRDGVVFLWDVAAGKELRRLPDLTRPIVGVEYSGDGRWLVVGEASGRVSIWDVAAGDYARRWTAHPDLLNAVAISGDGRTLVTTGVDTNDDVASLRFWQVSSGKQIALSQPLPSELDKALPELSALGFRPRLLRFSPDGKRLAVSGRRLGGFANHYQVEIGLWDVASAREYRRIVVPDEPLTCLAFSADGRTLITGDQDGTLRFWSAITGKELDSRPGHATGISSIALAPNGKTLVTAGRDSTLLVWEAKWEAPTRRTTLTSLTPRKTEDLWHDLAGEDAAQADRAIWRLVFDPGNTLALARRLLRPVPAVDQAEIMRLIAQFDSKKFAEREAARKELEKLGEIPESALRKVLEEGPSLEVRRRVEELLYKMARDVSPEKLQSMRALMVLEQIANADARRLLAELAKGAPEARLTREARDALGRLK